MYDINIKNNVTRLDIFVAQGRNKASRFGLIFILFCSIIIIFVPIVVFFVILSTGSGITFGFIITCILASIVSFYLFRLFLWNKYGKETYIIENDKFISFYDYKVFKDNNILIQYNSLKVFIIINNILMNVSSMKETVDFEEKESIICFEIDGKIIRSIGKIPIDSIIRIGKAINSNA